MAELQHILVIEDEDALSQALIDTLTQEGYRVTAAADGEEGLKIALEQHPDLIILDVLMPHLGGMEVRASLRQDPWGQNVPIIVLTNVANIEQVPEVANDPQVEIMAKSDSSLESVISHIKGTFDRQEPQQPSAPVL